MLLDCIKSLIFGTLLGLVITGFKFDLPAPVTLPPYFIIFGYYIGYKIITYFI